MFDTPIKLKGIGQLADEKMGGQLTELVKAGEISAKKKSISIVHTLGMLGVKKILFIGLGKEKELTFELLREAFGKASKTVQTSRVTSLSIALDTFITEKVDSLDAAHAFAEAFELATYKFAGYKQKANIAEKKITSFTIYSEGDREEIISFPTCWTCIWESNQFSTYTCEYAREFAYLNRFGQLCRGFS